MTEIFCVIVIFLSGCIRGVVGEGMPGYRRPFDKGNLYIKFEIEFPPNNFIPCDKISVSIFVRWDFLKAYKFCVTSFDL